MSDENVVLLSVDVAVRGWWLLGGVAGDRWHEEHVGCKRGAWSRGAL